MNPEMPIKAGVLGVGALGHHHARIYKNDLPGVELVGIFDTDSKRLRECSEHLGACACSGLEELAELADAVSVAVPTHLHRETGGRLLERGCHVLVEKPIAATTREAEEMVMLAQERNLVLQVGHVERFNPVLSILEQAGVPRFIEAHRLAAYPPTRPGQAPRGTEVSVVLDLMIHDLEVILHLVRDTVADIRAVGVPVLSRSEDIANVRLQFNNGCVANVTASRISHEPMRKIRVFLDDAYFSLDYQNQSGTICRLNDAGIQREPVPVEKGDALTRELKSFVRCIRQRGEPLVSGERGAEALRMAVSILESMPAGKRR